MRGFISEIHRSRAVGSDGRPMHRVSIKGHNFGKIAQVFQIYARQDIANSQGNAWLTRFSLSTRLTDLVNGQGGAFNAGLVLAKDAMVIFVVDLLNNFIDSLNGVFENKEGNAGGVKNQIPRLECIASVEGLINATSANLQQFQGVVSDLMESCADRPWNELFIEENSAQSVYVFRPTPYKTASGDNLQGEVPYILENNKPLIVRQRDIVSISLNRTDNNLANFFLVQPVQQLVNMHALLLEQLSSGALFDKDHPNNNPALYGFKRMEAQTAYWAQDAGSVGQSVQAVAKATATFHPPLRLPDDPTLPPVNPTPAKNNPHFPALSTQGFSDRTEYKRWATVIRNAEIQHDLPENLLARVAYQECSYNPDTIYRAPENEANAAGMFQFTRETAISRGIRPEQRYQPAVMAPAAAQYLRELYFQFGQNWNYAVVAYNWGPGNLQNWRAGIPNKERKNPNKTYKNVPLETQDYLLYVMNTQITRLVSGQPFTTLATPALTQRIVRDKKTKAISSSGASRPPSNQPASTQPNPLTTPHIAQQASLDSQTQWINQRRELLKAMNRDNALFEQGQVQVRGDTRLKPGNYVLFQDGNHVFEGYINRVSHQFQAYGAFVTTLMIERCTSFIVRNQNPNSPFFGEARQGVYEATP
jgi:soluble lytic murein transglycosylase-like protein